MITRKEFEDKLYNGKFNETELYNLRWFDLDVEESVYNDLKSIDDEVDSNFNRWTAPASFIFSYKNDFFKLNYDKALTELQEDYFNYQPEKVIRKTRMVEEVYWESAENEI